MVMMSTFVSLLLLSIVLPGAIHCLAPQHPPPMTPRRAFVTSAAGMLLAPAMANAKSSGLGNKDSVVQREKNTFLALINEFKNTDTLGGLDASTLNEPSIPFLEFGEKMKKGEVESVEFMAPSGAVAYATLKGSGKGGSGKRLRIGEGYPTGDKGSWSSPDFVIRSVSNFGVPYKFTVPALATAKYTKK